MGNILELRRAKLKNNLERKKQHDKKPPVVALIAGCQQFQPEATTKIKETKEHKINIEKKHKADYRHKKKHSQKKSQP